MSLLYLAFVDATYTQLFVKINQQFRVLRTLNSDSHCCVIGVNGGQVDMDAYEFEFIDLAEYADSSQLRPARFLAAEQVVERVSPDIIYFRYPFFDHHTFEFIKKFDNVVFEIQSIAANEVSPRLAAIELEYGPKILSHAKGIVAVTNELLTYELSRSLRPVPGYVVSNGISPESLDFARTSYRPGETHILCAAHFSPWHGIDRLIRGFVAYGPKDGITIHLAGIGGELPSYLDLVQQAGLAGQILFHGKLNKGQLDELSSYCQVGIGSLGLHRLGLHELCILKNREYCLRGIPFVYAGNDVDFTPDLPFLRVFPATDDPVDFSMIMDLARCVELYPEIRTIERQYAEQKLSWEHKIRGLHNFLLSLEKKSVANNATGRAIQNMLASPQTDRTKSILFAFPYFLPLQGGVEEVIYNLAKGLLASGWEVTVACKPHPDRANKVIDGIKVVEFDMSGCSSRGFKGDTEAFLEFLIATRFDVLYTLGTSTWTTELIGWNAEKIPGKKVWVPTGYYNLMDATFWPFYQKLPQFLAAFDAVIQLSENYRDAKIHRLFSLDRAVTIPNGVDPEPFQGTGDNFKERYGIAQDAKVLLNVSNHFFNKGHSSIISAFQEAALPGYHLIIIGNQATFGQQECLSACCNSRRPDIHILTDVPRSDVINAFNIADIFVLASDYECFPLTLLEAMASGTPFVATPVGNAPDLPGGLIVAKENLAAGITRLATDPALYRQLRTAGMDAVRERFTWNTVIQQHEHLFSQLLSQQLPHSPPVLSNSYLQQLVHDYCTQGKIDEGIWFAFYAARLTNKSSDFSSFFPIIRSLPLLRDMKDYYVSAAHCCLNQNDLASAFQFFQAALALDPLHFPTIQSLRTLEDILGKEWLQFVENHLIQKIGTPPDLDQVLLCCQLNDSPRMMGHLKELLSAQQYQPDISDDLITVVIPCFNEQNTLERTIDSVIRQNYTKWEVIIVDDGSTDDTSGVAARIIAQHPQHTIRIIRQENRGLSGARNTGTRAAKGTFIFYLDGNDEILPNCLSELHRTLTEDYSCSWAYPVTLQIGEINRLWSFWEFNVATNFSQNSQPCSSLIRRELFDAVGGFDEAMRSGYEDWNFWVSAIRKGHKGKLCRKLLFIYYKEAASMLQQQRSNNHEFTAKMQLIDNNLECYLPIGEHEQRILKSQLRIPPSLVNRSFVAACEFSLRQRKPSGSIPRILFYFFKNVHIPILKPIYEACKRLYPEVQIGFACMPYAPEMRAGFLPEELDIIHNIGEKVYQTPQEFHPDITFIADSVYPWVQGCGKLVHVGHGVLSKGQYYTDTAIARREEQADLVCVPGEYHAEVMRRIISKPVVATGMAKLDPLFSGIVTRESELMRLNLPGHFRYVLFAPTFNDELSAIPYVRDRIIDVLPDDRTVLLIKLHGSTKADYKDMYRRLGETHPRVYYCDDLDITPFLAIADLMISDVSSSMMEFAALDKPLVLFNNPLWTSYPNYNPADIEFTWRDIGFQVSSLEEMQEAVRYMLERPSHLSAQRRYYTDQLFANKYDGKGAERIVQQGLKLYVAEIKEGA